MSCALCGHRLVYHGDRAVAACDGGYDDPTRINRQFGPWSAPGPVCDCPGWKS